MAAANPVGKIPALVRDDGPALFDSRVISRFLDDRAGAGLYPAGSLWDVLTLEAAGDGICDAAVGIVYERRFREGPGLVWDDWIEAQWGKVARTLDALETRSMPLLQAPLHAGQIAVGCALGYLDFRLPERGWRDGRPALAAWEARWAERPAMVATRPA